MSIVLNEFPNYVMEESGYESFLVDDEVQGSKYPPLKLFPPDQEITCQYLGDIPPFPQYVPRGEASFVPELPYINPLIFPHPAVPYYSINSFMEDFQKHASLLFPNSGPMKLPLQGLLKDSFSSDPHKNFYDGAVKECDPGLDRLLKICVPNTIRRRTPSEAEAESNLLASDSTSKKFYAFANFLEPEPDLDLPASISLPKRLSFAAQDFLDSDEPEEPRMASARLQ